MVKEGLSGCPSGVSMSSDVPQLAITTASFTDANSDDKLLAKIRVNGEWTDWSRIDNAGCDDFEKGQTDYFDDFAEYTDAWEAIALYECGTDGIAIDSISYWDGVSNNNTVGIWCNNVAGIFNPKNYDLEVTNQTGQCYRGSDEDVASQPMYDAVWLDQNNDRIAGISFGTGEYLFGDRSDDRPLVGRLFFRAIPGMPDCGDYSLEKEEKVLDALTIIRTLDVSSSETVWMLYLALAIVAIGIVGYAVRRCLYEKAKDGWKQSNYGTIRV